MFSDVETHYVLDVGGDDRGALALGRFRKLIIEENNFEHFFVVNFYRPLTRDAESAMTVMNEIYSSCGVPFTSIINNSNLGAETGRETLDATEGQAQLLSLSCGLSLADVPADRLLLGGLKIGKSHI